MSDFVCPYPDKMDISTDDGEHIDFSKMNSQFFRTVNILEKC